MSSDGLPPLREVISRYGLSARKSLGQNFILDLNLTRRIARAAGSLDGKTVLEVGPGPGGLTRAILMEGAERVIAIERDERCIEALNDISEHYPGRLEIISCDALDVDYETILPQHSLIVANLPYSVASALLIKWLQMEPWPPPYERMTLMFQREVADRIVAGPGGKSYGRLSILSQWRTIPKIVLTLPAKAFTPPPKVNSALVDFLPRQHLDFSCKRDSLERVTAAAFGQRRKMLRSSLKKITPNPVQCLEEAGIDPSSRAENIAVSDFCRLAKVID